MISPLRQEMVDVFETLGPSSVREVARAMGVAPDALYYHIKQLSAVGLLREVAVRPGTTKAEVVYDIPGPIRLEYDPHDPVNVKLVGKLTESLIRLANRDVKAGLAGGKARTRGDERNLWAVRGKVWLSLSELRELNRVLERLRHRFRGAPAGDDRTAYALTLVLAPVKEAVRSAASSESTKAPRRKKRR